MQSSALNSGNQRHIDLYVNDELDIRNDAGDELDADARFSIVNDTGRRQFYVVKMVIFRAVEGMEEEGDFASNIVGNGEKTITLDPGESHNDAEWDSIELSPPFEVPSNPPTQYGVKVTIEISGFEVADPVFDFFYKSDLIPDLPDGLHGEF